MTTVLVHHRFCEMCSFCLSSCLSVLSCTGPVQTKWRRCWSTRVDQAAEDDARSLWREEPSALSHEDNWQQKQREKAVANNVQNNGRETRRSMWRRWLYWRGMCKVLLRQSRLSAQQPPPPPQEICDTDSHVIDEWRSVTALEVEKLISSSIYSLSLITVRCPVSVYWIARRRSTQSTTNCCYIDWIRRLESEVRPRNGSSPIPDGQIVLRYIRRENLIGYSKWRSPYRRVQFWARC